MQARRDRGVIMVSADYILPFCDVPVSISQGYNGPWSHKLIRKNTDQSYSLDFALPVGTDILAARDGILKFFYEDISSFYLGTDFGNGSKSLANLLVMQHDDGAHTCYQHFQKKSISALGLKANDYIRQGRVIGKTGLSGWIGNVPHLHFMAYTRKREYVDGKIENLLRTQPVKFVDYEGPTEHSELR